MSLIHLSQIKQGTDLKHVLDQLVLNQDVTQGFDPEKINLAVGEGTVTLADYIAQNDVDVNALETAVQTLREVELTQYLVNSAPDLASFSTSFDGEYPLFSADNKVLYDSVTNVRLVYSVVDSVGTLNGTGASTAVYTEGEDGQVVTSYEPYTGEVKAFRTSEVTLENLGNFRVATFAEITALAYGDAIDKLTVNMAADQTVIDAILANVGETSVEDAVNAAMAGVTGRLDTAEATLLTKADTSALTAVSDRVAVIEADYATQTNLNSVGGRVTGFEARLDATDLTIASKADAAVVTQLQTDVDAVELAVAGKADTSALSNVDGKVDALQIEVDALKSASTSTQELLTGVIGAGNTVVFTAPTDTQFVDESAITELYINGMMYDDSTYTAVLDNATTITVTFGSLFTLVAEDFTVKGRAKVQAVVVEPDPAPPEGEVVEPEGE